MKLSTDEMEELEEKTFRLRLRIAELERTLKEKEDIIASQAEKINKLEGTAKLMNQMLEFVKQRPGIIMENPTFQGPMYDEHDNDTIQNN